MIGKLRLTTGLILFSFVVCHFINHMFGLHSLVVMDDARKILLAPWRTTIGTITLASAIIIHLICAFHSIFTRRTFRLAPWEWAQIISGLLIPFLLVEHVVATRAAELVFGSNPSYRFVIGAIWVGSTYKSWIQALALIIVWGHGCIGLHHWLKTKPWYQSWLPVLRQLVYAIPTLSLAGFIAAGFEANELSKDSNYFQALIEETMITMSTAEHIANWTRLGWMFFAALILAPLVYQLSKKLLYQIKRQPKIKYADGRQFSIIAGASILETLRANNVPHAAVCGGRGRCSTCRVQITDGIENIDEAGEEETKALSRINAPVGLRLACQVRPTSNISIVPLLPADATAKDGRRPGGLEGQEKQMSVMFIDLRGSTKLGEEKLPFDVLYILNRFFAEMTEALQETGGHYAQFNGDGLMALYGLDSANPKEGAQQIIKGAHAMLGKLADMNESLKSELNSPLKMGIGIHYGEAIVGVMGPPQSQLTTAIGDNINITARLESLSKEYNVPVIISKKAAEIAEVSFPESTLHEVVVRGRDTPVHFYALSDLVNIN